VRRTGRPAGVGRAKPLAILAALLLASPGAAEAQMYERGGAGMMNHGMMGERMGPGMMGRGMTGRGEAQSGEDNGAGAQLFASQCAMCHTLGAGGANTVGPNLHGLIGRRAGSVSGYDYSAAMRRSGIVWDEKTLDRFLADPARLVPGTRMAFPGIGERGEREELIEYLKAAAG
jgi:cytochrome c